MGAIPPLMSLAQEQRRESVAYGEQQKKAQKKVCESYVSHFGFDGGGKPDSRATLVLDARIIEIDQSKDTYDDAKGRQCVVLCKPKAQELLAEAERHLLESGPVGTAHVAFGCGIGRHRSWALASELRRRMQGKESA